MKQSLTILISLISVALYSQNIDFIDDELKRYLLNEISVDVDSSGVAESKIDLNSDQEIQISEALAVKSLFINHRNDYEILSFEDLSNFDNLKELTITTTSDSFKNVRIDNLEYLSINNCSIKYIDLSFFPNLEDIRLHSLGDLKYVNIKNGNRAEIFSLFYSKIDSLICIDHVEYDQVYQWVRDSSKISSNCSPVGIKSISKSNITFYPVPAKNYLTVNSTDSFQFLKITTLEGKTIALKEINSNTLDISHLKKDLYLITFKIDNKIIVEKILKE